MSTPRPTVTCPGCGKRVKKLKSGKLARHKYMGRPYDPEDCPRSQTTITVGEILAPELKRLAGT